MKKLSLVLACGLIMGVAACGSNPLERGATGAATGGVAAGPVGAVAGGIAGASGAVQVR